MVVAVTATINPLIVGDDLSYYWQLRVHCFKLTLVTYFSNTLEN